MQTLWTQDAPQYSGPYCTFGDIVFQPKPVQHPVPIWVGGQSRAALRRTAQFATGWHPIDQSPTQLKTAMATLATLSQQVGRQTPELCPHFTVRVREIASDPTRQFMAGSTAQITEALLQIQALGAAHVVLSTQTNDLVRFRWDIETLAVHVIPHLR
jgi:alkanesulfonate monooxygenase SsuD/methylene tetrahydromethanopterin reductase-like flavin-dependent oxidoreductase (luciferase family)